MRIAEVLRKPFFGRYQKPWSWPEGVDPSEWTRVEFTNGSGARLVGLHGKARGPAKGVVVLPHPMHAQAKGYMLRAGYADFLREGGYDVFTFDFNGFGESEISGFEFPDDVWRAGQVAAAAAPGLDVALLGVSMGGGYGVCALDMPGHPFQVAVVEGAFTSLEEFWRPYVVPYLALNVIGWLSPRLRRRLWPLRRIRTVRGVRAMMFIHGTRDAVSPPSMGERFLEACPLPRDRRELWIVPEAKHLGALKVARDEFRRRVLAFLDANLARRSADGSAPESSVA